MIEKLWGGRFVRPIDKDFFNFQKSIHYDYKLVEYDLYHSIIHVTALKEAGILNTAEERKLTKALNEIAHEVMAGTFKPNPAAEDIHTDIQNKVAKRVGLLAQKLHTLRSRNDQVVFDEKWYCYKEGIYILGELNLLLTALNHFGTKYNDVFLPGYTHMQRAQVVSFVNYTGAYFCMFERDFERMDAFLKKSSIYIGSGALAGSAIPKSAYSEAIRQFLAKMKQEVRQTHSATVRNSLDNVASRDFVIEFLSILSMMQMHLSRMAEDFILYATKEYGFFDLPDEFCTGSSLMPHKKNPDFLELVRGSTGKVYGNLMAVLTTMKGLPLTYNRDMQFDKEPLFSSTELVKDELKIMARLIDGIKLKRSRIEQALEDQELYATELVEFLVAKGVAFSEAHTLIGRLMRYAQDTSTDIRDLPDKSLKRFHRRLSQKDVRRIMNPEYAVASKRSLSSAKRAAFAKPRKPK